VSIDFGLQREQAALARSLARGRPAREPAIRRPDGNGIYAYETKAGTRYRFVFGQSDGAQSNRRGFTSRRAAATARPD
jgi:hypothetical protein